MDSVNPVMLYYDIILMVSVVKAIYVKKYGELL